MEEASTSRQPLVPRKAKINVPVGFRFKPRDDELIVHYLKPKAYNQPLPPNMIEEVELYSYSPEALTEDPNGERKGETEWFFFTPRNRKYRNGSRPGRGTGDGYWKATGADKQVRYQGKIEGLKKTLVYYRGKPPGGKKTNWIMHEYVLKDPPPRQRAGVEDMRLDNWVLCKVYSKRQGKKLEGETSGRKGTTADKDEGECDGGAPPAMEEEEEEQQSSTTIAASPQIAVDQNGSRNIINPLQLHQHYNNMMLPQSSYYSNGYNNIAASTSGFSDLSGYLGLGQALSCYGNFVPTAAPISSIPPPHQFGPTAGSEYPLNMMIDDQQQFPSQLPCNVDFTDDERNFLLEKLNTSTFRQD